MHQFYWMSGECGEHFSSRRSWLSQHIFPCCVTSPRRESSSRCTLAFYIFSAVQPLSNVTVETLFPLSQSVGLSFLPSQPSFPFSFFSLGRFSSHPAPARWQSSLSPAWIIHCLFQKPRVQRCFFSSSALLCVLPKTEYRKFPTFSSAYLQTSALPFAADARIVCMLAHPCRCSTCIVYCRGGITATNAPTLVQETYCQSTSYT